MVFWRKKKKQAEEDTEAAFAYASAYARASFGYFYREFGWEMHRLIPGLDVVAIKIQFSDHAEQEPEHMWVSDMAFDGKTLTGTLNNAPNWVQSVKEGDNISAPIEDLSDWLFAIGGVAYGGFTTSVARASMNARERNSHDEAWGLDFGPIEDIRLAYDHDEGPLVLKNWNAAAESGETPLPSVRGNEHPMSRNMAPEWQKQLEGDGLPFGDSEDGWTMLHEHALSGNTSVVQLLLDHGMDATALTNHGMTPLQLAEVFGWEDCCDLLRAAIG